MDVTARNDRELSVIPGIGTTEPSHPESSLNPGFQWRCSRARASLMQNLTTFETCQIEEKGVSTGRRRTNDSSFSGLELRELNRRRLSLRNSFGQNRIRKAVTRFAGSNSGSSSSLRPVTLRFACTNVQSARNARILTPFPQDVGTNDSDFTLECVPTARRQGDSCLSTGDSQIANSEVQP